MNPPSPSPPVAEATSSPDRPTGSRWQRDRVAVVLLIVFVTALWFMRRRGPAQAMEEAMMLQAPLRALGGAVQGRDFDYFYGPLSLYLPAIAYKLAAPTLIVERAIGALYLGILGVALYFIGRRWSFWIGLCMGATALLIGSLSISALPIMGSVGLLVAAVAFATSDLPDTTRQWTIGLSLALAVDLRPDFLVWGAVVLVVLTVVGSARLLAWIAGAVGLLPYAILVLRAGFEPTFRTLVVDGLQVSDERRLPFHLAADGRGLLVLIGWAFVLIALVLGVRDRRAPRGVGLLGLAVIGLAQVPEYLQRSDGTHAVYVTMIPLALVAPVTWELLDRTGLIARRPGWREVAAIGVAAIVLLAVQPKFVLRATVRDARFFTTGGIVHTATNQGGEWYYKSDRIARDHQRIARAASRIQRPGDVLFVGPRDLARTTYSDGSFYTLLPKFEQRTQFYDFHPRLALDYGDRLAADVDAADVLVLCDVGFDEDNLSKHPGSQAANRVVASRFERVDEAAGCGLYRRIDHDR